MIEVDKIGKGPRLCTSIKTISNPSDVGQDILQFRHQTTKEKESGDDCKGQRKDRGHLQRRDKGICIGLVGHLLLCETFEPQ